MENQNTPKKLKQTYFFSIIKRDISKRACVLNFRRENDRFWVLAAHPEVNLFAAGHDSGMIVFKLEKERPAYTSSQEHLIYVKDKYFRRAEFSRNPKDTPIAAIKRHPTKISDISFSPHDNVILVNTNGEYEFYILPRDSKSVDSTPSEKGSGKAVFLGRKRIAVLHKKMISIKNYKNEEIKQLAGSNSIEDIFPADNGLIIIKTEDKISLYDIQQKRNHGEISTTGAIKQVIWAPDMKRVAILGKDIVILAKRNMEVVANLHEAVRVKSGAWDPNGIFLYSTHSHIKYCLPNGDSGIVRTLDSTLYITAVRESKVFCLDREAKQRIISIDNTEYMFKFALYQKKFSIVLKMVRDYNLVGQSMIAYLQKKGYPEVALHFVKNENTRFNLALSCGNISIALESAKALNDQNCWNKLATEALRQGNHQVVEMAYQKTKNFDKLSFLYLITGNTENAKRMGKIAEKRKDVMSWFHNALFLGDVNERIKILEQAGQIGLAYASAKAHGLTETAERLNKQMLRNSHQDEENPKEEQHIDVALPSEPVLLQPPIPIQRNLENNWPLLTTTQSILDTLPPEGESSTLQDDIAVEDVDPSAWDVDENLGEEEPKEEAPKEEPAPELPTDSWDIDLDIKADIPEAESKEKETEVVVLPEPFPSPAEAWVKNSDFAGYHCAAGSFETAMTLLNEQIGVINFAPLQKHFMALAQTTQAAFPCNPSLPGLVSHLVTLDSKKNTVPVLSLEFAPLVESHYRVAQKAITDGKFTEALNQFSHTLQALPLILPNTKQESSEVNRLAFLCYSSK